MEEKQVALKVTETSHKVTENFKNVTETSHKVTETAEKVTENPQKVTETLSKEGSTESLPHHDTSDDIYVRNYIFLVIQQCCHIWQFITNLATFDTDFLATLRFSPIRLCDDLNPKIIKVVSIGSFYCFFPTSLLFY